MRDLARGTLALVVVAALAVARTATALAPGVWPTAAECATHAGALAAIALVAGTLAALAAPPVVAAGTTRAERLAVAWPWAAVGTLALLPLADTVTEGLPALLAALTFACAVLATAGIAAARGAAGRALVAALPAAACAWQVAVAVAGADRPTADAPTIVLVTLDTARADAFDLCGDGPGRTPTLSALAARGRVFCRAYAPNPLTGPSHASLLTGELSPVHGVWSNGQRLGDEVDAVAGRLRDAGWSTRAVVSASVLDASLGFDRGFARFDSTMDGRLARAWPLFRDLGFEHRPGSAYQRSGAATLDLVDGRVPAHGAFVWVHLYDLHWPYTPSTLAAVAEGVTDLRALPDELRRPVPTPEDPPDATTLARGKALYYAQARDLDATLARLVAMVPPDAALVIVGDHGESLDEHGYWFTHGRLVQGADTWVPLVVVAPGVAPARIGGARTTADVAATILDLAGLPPRIGVSRSLLRDEPGPAWSFGWREPQSIAVQRAPDPRLGPLSSIARRQGDAAVVWWDRGVEARSVGDDPLDVGPAGVPAPEQLAPVAAQVDAVRATPAPRIELDQAAALEALGYRDP